MLYLIKLLRSLEVLSDWRIISESPELRYNRLNKVVKLCQTYMKCLTHAQWQQLSNPTECQKVSAILILELIFRIICPCHRQAIGLGNICQGLPRSKLLQDATWEGMEEGRGDVTSTVPGNMLRWGILKRGKTQWTMGHWGTLCGETNPKWAKNLWLWATAMKQTCLRHSRHSLHECLGSLNRKGGLVVKMSFLIQKMTTSGNGLPQC